MNFITNIKESWQSIPEEVKIFLKRALLIFIIWKIIYNGFLFNGRIIDKPLTDFSAKGAAKVMQLFYPNNNWIVKEECKPMVEMNNEIGCEDYYYFNGKKVLGMSDACNALELYVLYTAFLFAVPVSSSDKLKKIVFFSLTGILIIYLANIIRLTALAFMNLHRMKAVDMAHHYVFKMIVYALIFVLWILFTKKQKKYAENS